MQLVSLDLRFAKVECLADQTSSDLFWIYSLVLEVGSTLLLLAPLLFILFCSWTIRAKERRSRFVDSAFYAFTVILSTTMLFAASHTMGAPWLPPFAIRAPRALLSPRASDSLRRNCETLAQAGPFLLCGDGDGYGGAIACRGLAPATISAAAVGGNARLSLWGTPSAVSVAFPVRDQRLFVSGSPEPLFFFRGREL